MAEPKNISENVDSVQSKILVAMGRALNVTANAGHVRDLAEAYVLLDSSGQDHLESKLPRRPKTPLIRE
ncbi:hypothetical protein GCM10010525_00060 [Glutamicibacter bergerei]|jgi:hypothetical protein